MSRTGRATTERIGGAAGRRPRGAGVWAAVLCGGLGPAAVLGWGVGLRAAEEAKPLPAQAEPTAQAVLAPDPERERIERQVSRIVRFLADDKLEGRGPGTKGLDLAADFIADEFAKLGLDTKVFDGGPFQPFEITAGTRPGPVNVAAFADPHHGGEKQELKFDRDFRPLGLGGSGKLDFPLVFAGYGITAPEAKYDDYAGIDVKGKAVMVLRRLPHAKDPHSPLGADPNHSLHAPIDRKVSNAAQHGAACVILITDGRELDKQRQEVERALVAAADRAAEAEEAFKAKENPTDEEKAAHAKLLERSQADVLRLAAKRRQVRDPLLPFEYAIGTGRNLPVLHLTRAAADELLKGVTGKTLADYEKRIDDTLKPASTDLLGLRIQGEVSVIREKVTVKNVGAILPGEGPHADETIVVGAHYDHLGYGGSGSLSPGSKEIHNGADDNASGTAALLEVARLLTERKLKPSRRILFLAFTAEERGLLGSEYYASHPAIPLDKTVAMLNMDMVGRLRKEKLIVYGTGTSPVFDPLLNKLNETLGFDFKRNPEGVGPSDHTTFYTRGVPVLHFFTDSHEEYHTPRDDADLLDWRGIARVVRMVEGMTASLATAPAKPPFTKADPVRNVAGGPQGTRPYFGSIPAFGVEVEGMALQGTTPGGPAERAGLKGGDVVIKLGEFKIANLDDFDGALRKFKAGDKVPVVVKRGGEEKTIEVVLDPPK